jgi:hypothetical protein
LSFVWLFAGAPALRAQAPEAQKPELVLPTGVEVARLDVVVTEKRGHARAGLTREDFAVLEDGKPQPIVQFQAFARPQPAPPAGPAPPAATELAEDLLPARYIVLAVDDVHMEFESLSRVRRALARFLEEDLRPEDQVALVTTSQAELIENEDPMALDAAAQEVLQAGLVHDRAAAEEVARRKAETYYVLAYEPTNTKRDGGFRRIEVRLPGVRDVKVRTRSGYFALDDGRLGVAEGTAQAEVLRAGVLQGTAAPEPRAVGEPSGPVPHVSRIRLQRFEPGDYELRVTVTDRTANALATRTVSFTVE